MESTLPKYVCETCAGQLDIAYAFKRKYEDSIVKFVRQMSDQTEDGIVMTSESSSNVTEDVPDIKPNKTMLLNCSEANDLTVYEKFTIEEMKVKDSPQIDSSETLRPSDDMERLSSEESIDGTQHELAGYSSSCKDDDADYRALPQAILNKIYKYHRGRGTKPFKCDVCYRWFKTKGHIKAHRIRHFEVEKRIKCSKCQLMFLTMPHLHSHRCSTSTRSKSASTKVRLDEEK